MAYDDLSWVVYHFGLQHPYPDLEPAIRPPHLHIPPTPQSPRSPIGGKLGEKLRGLKLATSPSELANPGGKREIVDPRNKPPTPTDSGTGQRQGQHYFTPGNSGTTGNVRSALSTLQGGPGAGVASLNAMVGSAKPPSAARPAAERQETEDELFALPMSPRSPEMKKSPFSLIK